MRICTYCISIILFFFYSVTHSQVVNTDYQYALIEAVKQKNLGNIPGSIELYKMVLAENDSVAVAHFELGSLLALTGQKIEAKQHLEKAYDLDSQNEWYYEGLVDVLLLNEDYQEAAEVVKTKLESKDEEDVIHSFLLANIYFNQGKERKALRILNKIEKKHGVSDKIIFLKASIHEKKGAYLRALSEVDRILMAFPESPDYHLVAAELANKGGKEAMAVDYYKKVLDLDSTNIYAITNLTDYYREEGDVKMSLYYLNESFRNKNIEYDKKVAILGYYLSDEDNLNKYPDELERLIRTLLSEYKEKREVHLFGADFFIQRRDYNSALESLLPALTKNEDRYEIWKQGILLANATNEDSIMLSLSMRAQEVFPDSLEMHFYQGFAHYSLQNYDAVSELFSSDVLLDSFKPGMEEQARLFLAESLQNLELYTKSDSIFRSIIEEQPDNYLVMNNFAYYLSLRETSLSEARDLSFKTIERNPKNYTFLDTYAWILYKLKEYNEAEKFIEQALNYGGENDPDIVEHAADIHTAIGTIHIARAYYKKAIILGGDKEKLENKLKQIEDE